MLSPDDASDSDDDLEVIWEDETGAARDVDVAAGREPETTKPTGTPLSPSTVVSRGGSFGGGESIPPSSSTKRSRSSGSSSSRSSGSGSSRRSRDGIGSCDGSDGGSSPIVDGAGATGESTVDGYAVLPPELPKGEAGRLKSWGRHGDAVVSSRLRSVRNRLVEASEEQGAEGETALLVQMRALLVEILDEEVLDEEMQEAEEALSGYVFDELLDSLATSPPDYDAHESASNVLSLMCETANNASYEIALVIKKHKASLSWSLISKCLLAQCLTQRYLLYR